MYRDFKELLSLFNEHKVKYLVVGGYAVSYHAQPRATKDLDILIKADAANAAALYAALAEFGAPLAGLNPEDFIEKGKFYRMGHPPIMVDILPEISGVDFDAAWEKRVEVAIDKGLKILLIDTDSLLAAKLAAGRPEDLADAAALQRAARSVTEPQNKSPRTKTAKKKTPKP
ncbi:MAG: DUF6036 family nucleotidyltransferase [Syntrophobacteraceae bacterium]